MFMGTSHIRAKNVSGGYSYTFLIFKTDTLSYLNIVTKKDLKIKKKR